MVAITGTKVITNVALLDSALDGNKEGQIIGNKKDTSIGSSQKWTISEGPQKDSFVIKNDHYQKYLGYEGPDSKHLTPILTTEQHLWEIKEIHNHYKLEVYNVGVVCSLQSSDPKTPVIIKNFLDQHEEWILEEVTPDPPVDVTGQRRLVSVAYKDRAFDNTSPTVVRATSLHSHSGDCVQRYTISKVESDNAYLLKTDYNTYLGLSADKKNPISSKDKQLWDIIHVNDHYKLQAHKLDIVCSLQSGDDGANLLMGKYQGENEEWILEKYPVVTPAGAEQCPGESRA